MIFLGYFTFLILGAVFALVGAGGSILSMPILIYIFSLNPVVASSYSFYIVGLVALFSSVSYFKKKLISFKDVLNFAIPSAIGVIVARNLILPLIPDFLKNELLTILLAFFMILSGILSFKKPPSFNAGFTKGILSAGLIGLIVGILGAGGGFLIIPALHYFLRLDIKKTIGTSLTVISINCLIAISVDKIDIDYSLLLKILSFAILGMVIGLKFESKISASFIKKLFAIFTLILGIFISLQSLLKIWI